MTLTQRKKICDFKVTSSSSFYCKVDMFNIKPVILMKN